MARPRKGEFRANDDEGPRRRCIVTGAVRGKDELLRFVIGPDGEVVADIEGRLPGRGFWLSADRDVLEKACARNLFAKAARREVRIAADLAERVERLLVRRCLDLIGLARRAGQAVSGYEKAKEWLKSGRAGLVLAAADGSEGGRTKVRGLMPDIPLVDVLSADELGLAFGRERAVHVVVAPGELADRLRDDGARLSGLRRGAVAVAAVGES